MPNLSGSTPSEPSNSKGYPPMKRFLLFFILLTSLFVLSSCGYLSVPSFRLYVGYDLNPAAKIIPNDLALPIPKATP